jgi:hypothetical protein
MIFDFDPWELWKKGICIILLITFSLIPLHIFADFIKDKDSICDIEKKSKFILECLKVDTTKDVRAISACEQMSIRLYCK